MATIKEREKTSDGKTLTAEDLAPDAPVCGLIMPISATENHDEKHWAAVQTLLHRGIRKAGLQPANVWEGVNDRISKRIVSNIFRQDIVVADISDLNPNVMLELGLRLASKKPTVIVFEQGGKIPFDIGDVGALPYPGNLNILEMEAFFEKFSALLTARLAAFADGTYEPYLGDVVVEVLEPQTKEVSIGEAVLERLEEMARRMSRLEKSSTFSHYPPSRARDAIRAPNPNRLQVSIPVENVDAFERRPLEGVAYLSGNARNGRMVYDVVLSSDFQIEKFTPRLEELGGNIEKIFFE